MIEDRKKHKCVGSVKNRQSLYLLKNGFDFLSLSTWSAPFTDDSL